MENVTRYKILVSTHGNSTIAGQLSPDNEISVSLNVPIFAGVSYLMINFVIWIAIILGNLLVVESFRTEHSLRKSGTNMILFSMAVTDLLTGAIGLPLHVTGRILKSSLTCSSATRALMFLPGFFFCGLSLAHILFLAVER